MTFLSDILVTLGTGTVEELHFGNMTVDDEPPPASAWAWDRGGEFEAQGAFRHVRVAACVMHRSFPTLEALLQDMGSINDKPKSAPLGLFFTKSEINYERYL